MCPVIVSSLQFLPASLQVFLPSGQSEQFPEGTGGDQHTIIQIRLVWSLIILSISAPSPSVHLPNLLALQDVSENHPKLELSGCHPRGVGASDQESPLNTGAAFAV